jgi:hypothetical protein
VAVLFANEILVAVDYALIGGNLTSPGYRTMFSVPVWPRRLFQVSMSRFGDEVLERRQTFNAACEGISRSGIGVEIGIGIGTDERATVGLLMK